MARVTKDPDVRKQEILEAAVVIFSKKGYEHTKMSDIAEKLNVSQGLCYRYFPSKEDLFDSVVEHYAYMLAINAKQSVCDESLSLKQRLEQLPDYVALERQSKDEYYRFFHNKESKKMHDQLIVRICEIMQPYVVNAIKLANENGETDIADYDTAASFITYGQLGVWSNSSLSRAEKNEKIRAFLNYIFRQC